MKKSSVALLVVVFAIGACSPTTESATPAATRTNREEETAQIVATPTREPVSPRPTSPGRVKLGDLLFFASHLDFESDSAEDSWTEIYTIRTDGRDLTCLTCDLEEMTIAPGSAGLSPDRTMVAFSMVVAVEDNYVPMLYLFEVDTLRLRPVTYGTVSKWSPDGKYLTSGRGAILITDFEGNIDCISCEFEDQPGYYLDRPTALSWSPEGKWLAFNAYSKEGEQIFKITDDGKNWLPLTENPGFTAFRNPAWSPNGRYIAYDVTTGPIENISMETWVMDQDGTNHRCLTCDIEPLSPEELPYSINLGWSPKGELLVGTFYSFNPYQDGTYRILELGIAATRYEFYIATAEGVLKLLTSQNIVDSDSAAGSFFIEQGSPTWSPDGNQIAFASLVDGSYEIFVMDSDGSNLRQITDTPDQDEHSPFWLR